MVLPERSALVLSDPSARDVLDRVLAHHARSAIRWVSLLDLVHDSPPDDDQAIVGLLKQLQSGGFVEVSSGGSRSYKATAAGLVAAPAHGELIKRTVEDLLAFLSLRTVREGLAFQQFCGDELGAVLSQPQAPATVLDHLIWEFELCSGSSGAAGQWTWRVPDDLVYVRRLSTWEAAYDRVRQRKLRRVVLTLEDLGLRAAAAHRATKPSVISSSPGTMPAPILTPDLEEALAAILEARFTGTHLRTIAVVAGIDPEEVPLRGNKREQARTIIREAKSQRLPDLVQAALHGHRHINGMGEIPPELTADAAELTTWLENREAHGLAGPRVRAAAKEQIVSNHTPSTQTLSIMFIDLAGWSRLRLPQMESYWTQAFPEIARRIQQHRPVHANTWGDGVVATFKSVRTAAEAALDVRDFFRRATAEHGIPAGLVPRIALHRGDVLLVQNPLTERSDFLGPAVHVAARLEPKTEVGSVFCTASFKAGLDDLGEFAADAHAVGTIELAKGYGTCEVFEVRGPGESQTVWVPPS